MKTRSGRRRNNGNAKKETLSSSRRSPQPEATPEPGSVSAAVVSKSQSIDAQTRTEQVMEEVVNTSKVSKTSTKRVVKTNTMTVTTTTPPKRRGTDARTQAATGEPSASAASGGAMGSSSASASTSASASASISVSASLSAASKSMSTKPSVSPSSARRRMSSSAVAETRQQEKEELHYLNLRVQNLCSHFDNARCRDGSHQELRARLEKQNKDQQNKFRSLLSQFRLEIETKGEQLADANAEIRLLKRKLEEREQEIEAERKEARELAEGWEGTKNEFNDTLSAKEKEYQRLTAEVKSVRAQLEAAEYVNESLSQENDRLLREMESRLKEMEAEALSRLSQSLANQKEGFEKVITQMEIDHQSRIESLKERLSSHIAKLKSQVETQKKELLYLQDENLKLLKERNEATQLLQAEREARERATKMYREQRAMLEEQLEEKVARYSSLEETVEIKTHELFSCHEVNIGLKEEIAMLRKQLDAAERHHRVESPVRPSKRRRLDPEFMQQMHEKSGTMELRSVKAQSIIDQGFPLGIVTCQYKGDWKGFELANEWSKPIKMVGWRLTNGKGSISLDLPNKVVAPGEVLRICMNQRKEETDLLWRNVNIDLSQKQELVILDGMKNKHELLRMERIKKADADCIVM